MKGSFVSRWLLLFVALLSVPVLACGLFSGDETPADGGDVTEAEAVEAPTEASAAPTVDVADSGQPAVAPSLAELGSLSDALAAFNSYRMVVEMRFQDAADASQAGSMTLSTARVLDPPASSVEMVVSGAFGEDVADLGEGATLTFVEVGETSYSVIPGIGCISGAGGGEIADEFGDVLDAEDMADEIQRAEYVGEETVNGVATYHYRFDETGFADSEFDLSEATGDVYVSQEHGYVVRLVVDGTGQMSLFNENADAGELHLTMDVLDVGAPLTIEPPVDCDASGSEYPVMEGASGLSTFAGLTTYEVESTLQDAVTFYRNEMAARGYQEGTDQLITDTTALLTFSAEGSPTVSVTLNADGSTLSVLIAAEEG